jgi:hypothetical protein
MKMKRLSLVLMAFLAVSSVVKVGAADLGYGVKAHGAASMITNADKFFADNKAGMFNSLSLGYGGGLYGEYNLMDEVGVRVEALLNVAGTSYKGDKVEQAYNAAYLRIPVLAKIYPMGVDTGFSILVGPEVGLPVAMKTFTEKKKVGNEFKELEDGAYKEKKKKREEKFFNSFALGANVGVEYELPEVGVNFNLGYVIDFTKFLNTDDKEADGIKGDNNAMLQNIRLSVGYNIAAALA